MTFAALAWILKFIMLIMIVFWTLSAKEHNRMYAEDIKRWQTANEIFASQSKTYHNRSFLFRPHPETNKMKDMTEWFVLLTAVCALGIAASWATHIWLAPYLDLY